MFELSFMFQVKDNQEKHKIMILRQICYPNFQADQWVKRGICSLIIHLTEEKEC